jgi:hypothetical protein
MTDYCTILLNPATKSDILAACIQADAAIRAAHEQATASWGAGGLALIAGVGALIAGRWAYQAATRQIKMAEDQERLLTIAYKRQMIAHLNAAEKEIARVPKELDPHRWSLGLTDDRQYLVVVKSLIKRLSPDNWQELSRSKEVVDEAEALSGTLTNFVKSFDNFRAPPNLLDPEEVRLKSNAYGLWHRNAIQALSEVRNKLISGASEQIKTAPRTRRNLWRRK